MSDRGDRNLSNQETGAGANDPLLSPSHFSEESLNSYLDDESTAEERQAIELHLGACDSCRQHVRELRATSLLLQGLAAPALRRSFQLSSAQGVRQGSVWERFGSWLLPAMPALRTATIAITLLFVAVTIRNAVTDTSTSGPVSDSAPIALTAQIPKTTTAVPTQRNSAQIDSNQVPPTLTSDDDSFAAAPEETAGVADENEESLPAMAEPDESNAENADAVAFDQESVSEPATGDGEEDGDLAAGSAADSSSAAMESSLADDSAAANVPAGAAAKSSSTNSDDATTGRAGDEGANAGVLADSGAGSGSGGESESANSTFAMMAPASPTSATPLPATPIPATPAPNPEMEVTTESTPATSTAGDNNQVDDVHLASSETVDSSFWNVLQVALGVVAGLLFILVIVLNRRSRPGAKTAS